MARRNNEIHRAINAAMLNYGQDELAEVWDCDRTTANRRINGEPGIKLEDFAKALEAMGIQLVMPHQGMVAVRQDWLEALKVLAHESLYQERHNKAEC